jgi:hypothetical protein
LHPFIRTKLIKLRRTTVVEARTPSHHEFSFHPLLPASATGKATGIGTACGGDGGHGLTTGLAGALTMTDPGCVVTGAVVTVTPSDAKYSNCSVVAFIRMAVVPELHRR